MEPREGQRRTVSPSPVSSTSCTRTYWNTQVCVCVCVCVYVRLCVRVIHSCRLHSLESEEQRDSAVSCDEDVHTRDENLFSFSLPPPYIPTHALDNCQYPTVLAKFRDILVKAQKKNSLETQGKESLPTSSTKGDNIVNGGGSQRTFSNSSQTSIDSTGSSSMEQSGTPEKIPNGHIVSGEKVENGGSHDSHVISHDPSLMRTPSPRPVGTDAGNNTTTLNGERDHPNAASTSGNPTVGSGREPIHTHQLSWENRSSMDDSVFPSSPRQEVSDRTSVGSKDRSHENGQEQVQVKKRPLIRRATIPSNFMSRTYNSSPVPTSLQFSQGSSTFATSSQRYTGLRSMSINPGSMRVKMRPNPSANLSLRQKKVRKTSAGIVTPVQNPNLKILKIVLAGNDLLVSHMAKAYAYLQLEEPNLLSGMEVRFYYIPLSRASVAHWQLHEFSTASQMTNGDLPEPMLEQLDMSGNDIHIGRFLAHMDSWYERNVMLTVHHTLRLLPSVSWQSNRS